MSEWAREQAERLLGPLGRRWAHSWAVAERAQAVAGMLTPEDADVLVAAAYLHDIGYAPALATENFHPLDGARWLADQGYDRMAGLVAHHSGAKYEAALRGLAAELAAYREENSLVAAALAYCDLTTGPAGGSMTPDERLADVEVRHGGDSPVTLGMQEAWPELLAAVATVEERLADTGAGQPM